jgi:hypothetical protein
MIYVSNTQFDLRRGIIGCPVGGECSTPYKLKLKLKIEKYTNEKKTICIQLSLMVGSFTRQHLPILSVMFPFQRGYRNIRSKVYPSANFKLYAKKFKQPGHQFHQYQQNEQSPLF